MHENEDVILPDDFTPEETSQPEEELTTDNVEETPETPAEEEPTTVQPDVEDAPKFKIKYNHEEMELGHDEAIPLIQKGMNYDKLQERLQFFESDPRLSFVEELADEYGMTPQEFIESVREQREQAKLDQLIQQNIPEELAQEILESRKDREQRKAELKEKEIQEKRFNEVKSFQDYYKEVNGKFFDFESEKLPIEVLEAHQNGTPLKDAYVQHENRELRNKLKVLEQNAKNSQKAPITGVTTHGSTSTTSQDPFEMGFDSVL